MSLGRAWARQLYSAGGAALLAPAAVLCALVVLALAGGLGHLGTLGQAVAGPSLPRLPNATRPAGSGTLRHHSALLVALAAPAGAGGAVGPSAGGSSGAAPGSRRAPGSGRAMGSHGGHSNWGPPSPRRPHGGPPPSGPPAGGKPPSGPPPPAPHPTVVDGVVSLGSSVTHHVHGPVGSVATQTLQSVGHTLDGILPPPAAGRPPSGVPGLHSRARIP